jgi:hypothetical protein
MANKWLKILSILFSNFIIWVFAVSGIGSIFFTNTFWFNFAIFCSLISLLYLFYFLEREKELSENQKIISKVTYVVPKIIGLICLALLLLAWTWISLFGCSWTVCTTKNYLPLGIEWFLFVSLSVVFISKEAFLKGYIPIIKWILIIGVPVTLLYLFYNLFLNAFQ